MTPRARSTVAESVAQQLHTWKPFMDGHAASSTKKPCRSDRSTAPVQDLDLSMLSLREESYGFGRSRNRSDRDDVLSVQETYKKWLARKRRRRTSRSVSGRSSDISTTCVTLMSAASDSSNDHFSFASSDLTDLKQPSINPLKHPDSKTHLMEDGGGGSTLFEDPGKEGEGYGSEPGYRGDAEFGYDGDEFDDEDDIGDSNARFLLWADHRNNEDVNVKAEQKSHHRCRRKKQDWRVMAS